MVALRPLQYDPVVTPENIREAAARLREAAPVGPGAVGLVLGSGLGGVAEAMEDAVAVPYAKVPHMAPSTAPLHEGRFVMGSLAGRRVVCMQGRLHAYEGYSAQQVTFPIYVLRELGVSELVVTNAAGGIDASFEVGDLMLIEDHINFLFRNPCIGPENPEVAPRFFDMTNAYDPGLRAELLDAAQVLGLGLRRGVLISNPGPSFETPAEIRAYRALGADAVCMSTVLEVIAANSCGMKVLGVSMISNPAAGVSPDPLDMDDVSKAARLAAENVGRLLACWLERRGR